MKMQSRFMNVKNLPLKVNLHVSKMVFTTIKTLKALLALLVELLLQQEYSVDTLEEIQLPMLMVLLPLMISVPLNALLPETIATGTLSMIQAVDYVHFTQVLASLEQLVLEPVIHGRRSKCATGLLLMKFIQIVTVKMLLL